jgi:hypothetical protein
MNDETIELVKRHREAAHEQGVIVGTVYACAVLIVITLIAKLFGVTCG